MHTLTHSKGITNKFWFQKNSNALKIYFIIQFGQEISLNYKYKIYYCLNFSYIFNTWSHFNQFPNSLRCDKYAVIKFEILLKFSFGSQVGLAPDL